VQELKANLVVAADGGTFKKSFWAPLLKQFAETHTASAFKGWEACNSKWQRACADSIHKNIKTLSQQSGFHWDNEHSAAISIANEAVWHEYIKYVH
ncbi:hypothetical protein SERLA73DRAFT_38441, partial [Serpula lacrymans var. lacrymans S7.3]